MTFLPTFISVLQTRDTMNSIIDRLHPVVLNVGYAIHNGDWNWKNVNSPFTRLYYVDKGTAKIKFQEKVQILNPGYLYFIPAFTIHSYICDSHFCHYYLHIYEGHSSEASLLDEWDFPVEIAANDLDIALIKQLCAINPSMKLPKSDPATYDNNSILMQNLQRNSQRTTCVKLESRGIIYQLLAHFFKEAVLKVETQDNRIAKSILYIRKHIYETISLDFLADNACLSKDHFIRLFKKETGTTPLKYINQKKIEKAQLLLVTDTMSIKNIALTLAFEDYSYFNRLFKKITGMTPQEYRNSSY